MAGVNTPSGTAPVSIAQAFAEKRSRLYDAAESRTANRIDFLDRPQGVESQGQTWYYVKKTATNGQTWEETLPADKIVYSV